MLYSNCNLLSKKCKFSNLGAKVRKKNGLRKQRGLFFEKNNFIAFSLTRKDSQKMPNEQLF
mgnify:FL=1